MFGLLPVPQLSQLPPSNNTQAIERNHPAITETRKNEGNRGDYEGEPPLGSRMNPQYENESIGVYNPSSEIVENLYPEGKNPSLSSLEDLNRVGQPPK